MLKWKGDCMGRFVQIVTVVVLILFLLPGRQVNAAPRVQNIRSEEKVVIVIDPGHGGEIGRAHV